MRKMSLDNSAVITVVEDEKVFSLLQVGRKAYALNPEVGVRAFVWNVEQTV